MKALFTTVALGATLVAFPALADVGCKWENGLNDSLRLSNCNYRSSPSTHKIARGDQIRTVPSPLFRSDTFLGMESFAYVPPRRSMRGMSGSSDLNQNSLENETRLEGGSD